MNEINKAPTQGQGMKTVQSTRASIDAEQANTFNVICVVERPKAVLLSSVRTHEKLWFKKSQVKVLSGDYGQGALLEVQIDKAVLVQARAHKRLSPVQFTDSVLVTGYCTRITEKAIGVLCDADRLERCLAKNKISKILTVVEPNEAVRLLVPAWMLKCADGAFPSWVKGARV